MADDLLNLQIETWRTGTYGPGLDPAVFMTFQPFDPGTVSTPDASLFTGGAGDAPPVTDEVTIEADRPKPPPKAFVPPVAPPVVLPPTPTAAPPAGLVAGAAGLLTRLAGPIVGLFMPTPTAPQRLDDPTGRPRVIPQPKPAPKPEPEFEVIISPPRSPPRAPPRTTTPANPDWWTTPRFNPTPWNPTSPPFPFGDWNDPDAGIGSDDDGAGADGGPTVDPDRIGLPAPDRRARPDPRVRPAPDVRGAPFPGIGDFPFGLPQAEPLPFARAAPRPAPAPGPNLSPWPDVFTPTETVPYAPPRTATPTDTVAPLVPFADVPTPQLVPQLATPLIPARPPTKDDTCSCAKPKKKRKPKKDRTECRRGTYVQTRRGISYSPKEIVPCR